MNFQRLLFVASLFIGSVCTSAAYGSSNPHLSADDCNVSGFTRYKMSAPKTDYEVKQQSDSAMQWMHDAKIGMFIHWGLYAGPARGEWNMNNKGIMPEEYRKLAYAESGDQYFDASLYNPKQWMDVARSMGARYTVLTTMHHDGYALFDSHYMNAFSSRQTLNRDLVREYVDACRNSGMRVGLYKTLINWRYPGYYDVTGTDCKPNKFGYTTAAWHKENARLMKEELYSDTRTLMTEYGKIDMMFWDGGWLAEQGGDRDAAYFWESYKYVEPDNQWQVNPYFLDRDEANGKWLGLIGMVRKHQPDILMNPRTGWIGDYTCDEGPKPVTGKIRERIQEKCLTIAGPWGYSPAMDDESKMISVGQLKRYLADCIVRGMNFLINVGPDRHVCIPEATSRHLAKFGSWVDGIAEAVYATSAGPWQPVDGKYGFCYKDNRIYIYLLGEYTSDQLALPAMDKGYRVRKAYALNGGYKVSVKQKGQMVTLGGLNPKKDDVEVIVLELNKNI